MFQEAIKFEGNSSGVEGSAKHLSGRGLGLSLVSSDKTGLYRHFRYVWKEGRISNTLIIKNICIVERKKVWQLKEDKRFFVKQVQF